QNERGRGSLLSLALGVNLKYSESGELERQQVGDSRDADKLDVQLVDAGHFADAGRFGDVARPRAGAGGCERADLRAGQAVQVKDDLLSGKARSHGNGGQELRQSTGSE